MIAEESVRLLIQHGEGQEIECKNHSLVLKKLSRHCVHSPIPKAEW